MEAIQKRVVVSRVGTTPQDPTKLSPKDGDETNREEFTTSPRSNAITLILPSPTANREDGCSPLSSPRMTESIHECLVIKKAVSFF